MPMSCVRLIIFRGEAETVSLRTSPRVSDKFLTVFSVCINTTDGNAVLILYINNKVVIPPGRLPE